MATKGNLGDMESPFTTDRFARIPIDELTDAEMESLTFMLAEMDN